MRLGPGYQLEAFRRTMGKEADRPDQRRQRWRVELARAGLRSWGRSLSTQHVWRRLSVANHDGSHGKVDELFPGIKIGCSDGIWPVGASLDAAGELPSFRPPRPGAGAIPHPAVREHFSIFDVPPPPRPILSLRGKHLPGVAADGSAL